MSTQLAGAGSYDDPAALENDYVRPSDQEEDQQIGSIDWMSWTAEATGDEEAAEDAEDFWDRAGDVVYVRDDPSEDSWDGAEWLKSQSWFDTVWEGHENDSEDLPGPATWGTEDSFVNDPSGAIRQLGEESGVALEGLVPGWVSWAAAALLVTTLLAVLSYAFGQLVTFTTEV